MEFVREKFTTILQNYYSLKSDLDVKGKDIDKLLIFLTDRRNASFGDSLINFIYSCSKSLAINECTGVKISDSILLKGFNDSNLLNWLKIKGKKKDQANGIEALIFYMWLVKNFQIENMCMILLSELDKKNLNNSIDEKRYASIAFTKLFNAFDHKLSEN